ncbi:MAG: type IX secretion system membrane protein PorP/SprF [Flavobacteriales bacterium]|nr:type IX secretion system membrane protein PorP/SprF [Flavobacteriales bacterium]
MKKIVLVAFISSLFFLELNAQQQAHLTQYFDNYLYANPAYAGSSGMMNVSGIHREQWVGFEGAPRTSILGFNMPLKYESVGVGANVIRDEIGPTSNTQLQLSASYRLKFDEKNSLSFGLNAGFGLLSSLTSALNSTVENDPSKLTNQQNRFMPNLGAGLLFKRERLFVGISAPKLFQNSLDGSENNLEKRHFFTQIGGVINLDETWKLRPSTQLIFIAGAPINLDISLATIYQERFIFGAMYRLQSAFGVFVQYQINDKFRVSLASDFSTQAIRSYNYGTYEIGLAYDLSLKFHKGQTFRYF